MLFGSLSSARPDSSTLGGVTGVTGGVGSTFTDLPSSTPAPFCSGAGGWLPQAARSTARVVVAARVVLRMMFSVVGRCQGRETGLLERLFRKRCPGRLTHVAGLDRQALL